VPVATAPLPALHPVEETMITIYSEDQRLHFPRHEILHGELVTPFECPQRMDMVLERIRDCQLGSIQKPEIFPDQVITRVHSLDYVAYLESAWAEWTAMGRTHDILPYVFNIRSMCTTPPRFIDAKVGYYAMDGSAQITKGTWQAARSAVNVAMSAQQLVAQGARSAFALCRPPGHHAGRDYLGGYCYLNNAAIAAQAFVDQGARRVAVLDVDYHHGNGTQQIFYDRDDVMFLSIHADPEMDYPHYLGSRGEVGVGRGHGFNHNYPLALGAGWEQWGESLAHACHMMQLYAPDAIVVSLGVDTYKDDPISTFKLDTEHYLRIGESIARLRAPTVFVMEGGYAVEEIGTNVVGVLQGFESVC
jgi:acetoin utilization deacetylase AcuC-like enzyme